MAKPDRLTILYHGHSTIELITNKKRLLIDPFFTSNPLAKIKASKLKPDFILLSHAHLDHTEDALAIAKKTGAPIAANYEIATYYEKRGVNVQPMNTGGSFTFPFFTAKLTLAFHSSSFADGTYGGEPNGWIIHIAGRTIYFAGDTALFHDMKDYGKQFSIDLACLPIGDCFTMGPDDAGHAAEWLGAKAVLPIHYNTFPEIQQDPNAFAKHLKKKHNIKALSLKPGESAKL